MRVKLVKVLTTLTLFCLYSFFVPIPLYDETKLLQYSIKEENPIEQIKVSETAEYSFPRIEITVIKTPIVVKKTKRQSTLSWSTFVSNSGWQESVDLCAGGLTYGGNFYGKDYFPIHRDCGGNPILSLQVGDKVEITGSSFAGVYTVVSSKDVLKGETADAFADMDGRIIFQTCYSSGDQMRLVGLS